MRKLNKKFVENSSQNLQSLIKEKITQGLLIKIECDNNLEIDDFKLAPTTILYVCALVNQQKESKLIEGVCAMRENCLEDNIGDFNNQTYVHRVLRKKNKVIIE